MPSESPHIASVAEEPGQRNARPVLHLYGVLAPASIYSSWKLRGCSSRGKK
jgi:hypothetical protein